MFALTAAEWAALTSQIATLKPGRGQHRKYPPYVFTEHGAIIEEDAIHARHAYQPERVPSWWGDYGFVLNGRRVMIWWVHPRRKYADEISDRAWKEAGPPPDESDGILDTKTIWRKVGHSRKKIFAHQSSPTPDAWRTLLRSRFRARNASAK